MKKLLAFIFLFSAAAWSVSAQKKLYLSQNPKVIEWSESPKIHTVPPEYANEDAVILLHDVDIRYKYEGHDTNTFFSMHNIIKVLDERGIEMFNTVRIPVNFGTRFPLIKARTISPSGRVQDIDKEMIKVTKESSGRYLIAIAMEGVEVNSEIEYLVKTIRPYTYFNKIDFQFEVPIASARFDLSYPKEFIFEMKSHNGFPELRDTLIKGRKHVSAEMMSIPALENEPHSFPELHRMAIEYRASYNYNGNNEKAKMNTLNGMARKIFDTYYKFSEKDRKAVNAFLTELGVHANGNERENIKRIEQGIKTRITLYSEVDYDQRPEVRAVHTIKSVSRDDVGYDENKDMLDTILSKKAATDYGYIKLFAACFTQAGIRHELGLAGDRGEHTFNAQFESWMDLNNYLFYFPNQKRFLDPENIYLRYPVIDDELVGGKGIFCTIPTRGEVTGNVYAIRTITPLSERESGDRVAASVTFDKKMEPTVDVAYSWFGYRPTKLRKTLPFTRKDKMKDLITSLIPFADKPEDIERYSLSNEGFENYYDNKPLGLYALVHPTRLVSKADKQYLFKLGAIIGPHFNLYAEDKREMPVDFYYPFYQSHTITINIPKGCKILNPESIRMSADYLNGDLDQVISFSSDYKLVKDRENGDKLIVTVNEYYNQLHFTLNEYDRYRKVVNTAADFNKVTLLIADNRPKQHHAKKTEHTESKIAATNSTPPAIKPAPTVRPTPTAVKPAPVAKTAPAPAKPATQAKPIPVNNPPQVKPIPVGKPPVIKVGPPAKK